MNTSLNSKGGKLVTAYEVITAKSFQIGQDKV